MKPVPKWLAKLLGQHLAIKGDNVSVVWNYGRLYVYNRWSLAHTGELSVNLTRVKRQPMVSYNIVLYSRTAVGAWLFDLGVRWINLLANYLTRVGILTVFVASVCHSWVIIIFIFRVIHRVFTWNIFRSIHFFSHFFFFFKSILYFSGTVIIF